MGKNKNSSHHHENPETSKDSSSNIDTSYLKMQKMCDDVDDMTIEGRNTAGISSLDHRSSDRTSSN